jgi:peptidoglycan/LPS O-acetylase OafA/YrhL
MVFSTHALGIPLLWIGVDLFFVISGYLITGILLRLKERRGIEGGYWKPFYQRRIRRIIPPYVAFLIVLSFFFSVPWAHLWYWYAFFGANFALAFGKVSVTAMTPLWSLAIEEQFYFVWPWIVLLCSRETLRRVSWGVIIAAPFLRAAFTPVFTTHFPIYSLAIFRADTLAVGALIAVSEAKDVRWTERHRNHALGIAGVVPALFGACSYFPSFRTGANSIFFNSIGYSLSAVLFGSVLVFTLVLRHGHLYSILTARPVKYLGMISYTFYLYHVAVLLKIEGHLHSTILVAVSGLAVTTAIAALSWRFFESPILKVRQPQRTSAKALPANV